VILAFPAGILHPPFYGNGLEYVQSCILQIR